MTTGQAVLYRAIVALGPVLVLGGGWFALWAPVGRWRYRKGNARRVNRLLRAEARHRAEATRQLRAADRRPRRMLDAGTTWRTLGARS